MKLTGGAFFANVVKKRQEKVSAYYMSLSQDLVALLAGNQASGVEIFEHVLAEHDCIWQVPPIETAYAGRKYSANFLKDVKGALHGTVGSLESARAKWLPIALNVGFSDTPKYVSYIGYTGIYYVTGLSAVDSKLIFTPPAPETLGTLQARCLFALESAAFFGYVFNLEIKQGELTYCVATAGGTTGVLDGRVFLDGQLVEGEVSKDLLSISLRLPRGPGYEIRTKDTIDAIRTWAEEQQVPKLEYILDVLSILRLGRAGEHLIALNSLLLEMLPAKKPAKYVSYHDKAKVAAMRKVLTMEQRELAYIKVQDILNDQSRVDKVKLLDAAEILIPTYMSYNSFVSYIGYPSDKHNSAAVFTKARYDKMLAGWAKFREQSLEKARKKLNIKFEDS